MIDCVVSFNFTTDDIMRMAGIQDNGPVQYAIDQAVVEYAKPYWAWDTGNLANSAVGIGTGTITYTADYAHELYYGTRADGKPINYHHDKNPLAGPYPVERMKADHMNDIVQEVLEVVRNQQH